MKRPYAYQCIPQAKGTTKPGDRALAAFNAAYNKAMAGENDPDGLLRDALKWGSSPAALTPPQRQQNPMDAARIKAKDLLDKSSTSNQAVAKAHELVHSLLCSGQ